MIKLSEILNEDNPCWKGYKVGDPKTKISSRTGKRVNNCIPVNEAYFIEASEKFQNTALDKINKVGGFDRLPDIDKLALLGGSNDKRLKLLDLEKIFRENGGTFGLLEIKVRVKDINQQPIEHRFSQEFAGKEGYLSPYINYSDNNEPYVTVRFDEFVSNLDNFGGGNYEGRPIMLANMYPIDYDEIKSDFVDYQNKIDFERDEFRKHFDGDLDEINEYDVENEQDIREFIEFMREYQQQLNEADCDCLLEAKYQGRTVPLGKPMRGDSKKFKVYVKNPKTGKVIKVNFGAKGMNIKKNNPKRRKAFRARHNCANPGPRTKARYWSCRKW
jgi:hypothetical protein